MRAKVLAIDDFLTRNKRRQWLQAAMMHASCSPDIWAIQGTFNSIRCVVNASHRSWYGSNRKVFELMPMDDVRVVERFFLSSPPVSARRWLAGGIVPVGRTNVAGLGQAIRVPKLTPGS